MRKIVLITVFAFTTLFCSAQTFWLETWSGTTCASLCTTYTGPNGAWATTTLGYNGPAANVWYFSQTEEAMGRGSCGQAGGPATAHVGNVSTSPAASIICPSGDCGALNDDWSGAPSDGTNVRLESPTINCTGKSGITLFFNYIEQGDTIHDYATLWYYNGSTWTMLAKPPQTNNATCSPQGMWTYYSISLPASANNNANVKIGFTWYNDTLAFATINQDYPSVAIDSIGLSAAPTGVNNISNNVKVAIYPNPNRGMFTLQMTPDSYRENSVVEIFNTLGQKVYTSKLNSQTSEMDMGNAAKGVYLYRIITENGNLISSGKFTIE